MTLSLAFILASRLFGLAFVVLLGVGLAVRIRQRGPHRTLRRRQIQALAATRYARGEVGVDEYRQLRDDLKDLV